MAVRCSGQVHKSGEPVSNVSSRSCEDVKQSMRGCQADHARISCGIVYTVVEMMRMMRINKE